MKGGEFIVHLTAQTRRHDLPQSVGPVAVVVTSAQMQST
jgi:hypothetical protein